METATEKIVRTWTERFCAPKLTQAASEWICENVRLDEPKIKGAFSLTGREYLREILDAWGPLPEELAGATDFALCAGTGIGKTVSTIGGLCYRIGTDPMRCLCVKPTSNGPAGAGSFSKTRLRKAIKATPLLRDLIPTGSERFDFAAAQMQINGSVIDLTGSNSVGQLGENRCDVVLQDEIDKYPQQTEGDREASPVVLADERTKNVQGARRYKYSTPTMPQTGIWEQIKMGDMRRYFVPCPNCCDLKPYEGLTHVQRRELVVKNKFKGWIVLAWSKQFTVFQLFGYEAFVRWADEARDPDGKWDYDKVMMSAHYVCPHCQFKIRDHNKHWMISNGEFIPTAKGIPGIVSWHLPSLYSTSPDCSVGNLARKFLKAKHSLDGVKGFINSDLAEPEVAQMVAINRAGIVGKHIELTGEWLKILSADYHANAPYFWSMVGAWNGSDQAHMIEYRAFNNWYELDEFQSDHKVIPEAVIIDAGHAQSEVTRECCDLKIPTRCYLAPEVQDRPPEAVGWQPSKSFGGRRLYRVVDEDGSVFWQPWKKDKYIDPFVGTELMHTLRLPLLEFLEDEFEDMLQNILDGKTGLKWSISPEVDTDEYHRHVASKQKRPFKKNPKDLRWQTYPVGAADHLRLCAELQLVMAVRLQLVNFEAITVRDKK